MGNNKFGPLHSCQPLHRTASKSAVTPPPPHVAGPEPNVSTLLPSWRANLIPPNSLDPSVTRQQHGGRSGGGEVKVDTLTPTELVCL